MQKKVNFKQGEEKREELELPTLHFVVMDQWIDVIGEKALLAWLKMYTWCDRDRSKGDKPVDINLWEQSKIPDSFTKIRKKLGVGNDTFYNKIIKPLWNVGLIDIEEWDEDPRNGQKAMNIIIYKYPQNDKSLSFQKIKEVRNYDSDYSSKARTFAKRGGRPKKNNENNDQNNGGSLSEQGVFSNRTGGVLSRNGGVFSLGTEGGSEIEHNNIFNSFSNSFNSICNILNNYNNSLNSSSSSNRVVNIDSKQTDNRKREEDEEAIKLCNQNIAYDILGEFLHEKNIEKETIIKTLLECNKRNLDFFTIEDVKQQYEHMMEKKQYGERIYNFATYFANGLKDLTEQTNSSKVYQQEKIREYELAMQRKQERAMDIPYYNWLEEE